MYIKICMGCVVCVSKSIKLFDDNKNRPLAPRLDLNLYARVLCVCAYLIILNSSIFFQTNKLLLAVAENAALCFVLSPTYLMRTYGHTRAIIYQKKFRNKYPRTCKKKTRSQKKTLKNIFNVLLHGIRL